MAKGTCTVEQCDRPVHARGLCNAHRQRLQLTGSVGSKPLRYSTSVAERVAECTIDGCTSRPVGRGWCSKHYARWQRGQAPTREPVAEDAMTRFMRHVSVGPPPDYAPDLGPCWLWTAAVSSATGYGNFSVRVDGRRYHYGAHRWLYEQRLGAIEDGLQLDHLCRVRRCVRPDHLEPVTALVNTMRGTSPAAANSVKDHCVNNHEFTEENTYYYQWSGRTKRMCRTCHREYMRSYMADRRKKLKG